MVITALMLSACGPARTETPIQPAPTGPTETPAENIPLDAGIPDSDTLDDSGLGDTQLAGAPTMADRFSDPVTAEGQVIVVYGRVLDVNGEPVTGAAVEIWQTDANGIYDHPGDSSTANRDAGFQFYGTSITDADGLYVFRTIAPGRYEPRPRHIHLKVNVEGRVILISQLYFAEDNPETLPGGQSLLLVMDDGFPPAAGYDLVVDLGIGSGILELTPSQGEGPYYPVVPVGDYDNDLAAAE